MDEFDGHLRVAFTRTRGRRGGGWWGGGGTTDNGIAVLAAPTLDEVGELSGLGLGESIRAIRFSAELAYMVTFEQIDPLYTIDLADPASPRTLGELKITELQATNY